MECIICTKKSSNSKPFVKNSSLESFKKLLERSRERARYKDNCVLDFVTRTENLTPKELLDNNAKYHESCYSSFANTVKLQRAKKRYNESIDTGESSIVKRKPGRPSTAKTEEPLEGLTIRSKSEHYDKKLCIICQKVGGKIHNVQFIETGKKMLEVSEKLNDKGFFRRLNTISSSSDAVANDVVYHNACWADAKQNARPKNKEGFNFARTLSDMELINFVEKELMQQDSDRILDMNMVNSMYIKILSENSYVVDDGLNYKKYLKELIESRIPDVTFVKNMQKNKPERLMTSLGQSEAVEAYADIEAGENDIKALWRLAKRIRTDALSQAWEFNGNFENYKVSSLLSTFLKWVLLGPRTENEDENNRSNTLSNLIKTTSLFVSQNMKTTKQVNYVGTTGITYSKIETPLNVGIGLYLYHLTRSKKLINFLSDLNIGINYTKVVNIKKDIVQTVLSRKMVNNDIFVPSTFTKGHPVFFAVDNIDLKIDTPDGKKQLHGTATVAYQLKQNSKTVSISDYVFVSSNEYITCIRNDFDFDFNFKSGVIVL